MMGISHLDAELLTVGALFGDSDATYTVPVYQRNFAWRAEQIEQLINDISDAIVDGQEGYFVGNLIVTPRALTRNFEVVDGQQRLTTLYILLAFLARTGSSSYSSYKDRLRYQSRPRATEALRRIEVEASRYARDTADSASDEDAGIQQGFNVIQQFMDQHIQGPARARFADFLCTKVTLVRASLPRDTDLNRYFEVMNTRGQQLQQVDIVKARLMSRLKDEAERASFAWIWEACADMDSYVQMSLTPGDTDLRTKVFGEDWRWLKASEFAQLVEIHRARVSYSGLSTGSLASKPMKLDEALAKYAAGGPAATGEDEQNLRFRSAIEFPAFLLHVLKVLTADDEEDEGALDDKRLIKRFGEILDKDDEELVRRFAFELLRCRNLFDSFVLKRQYTATNGDDGDWSMQRLIKRVSRGRAAPTPGYVNTFQSHSDVEEDGDVDVSTHNLMLIQSMLRVTYTAPRTMHWTTRILKVLVAPGHRDASYNHLLETLQDYSRRKVREAFFDADEPAGFSVSRIVFTYLDYLLIKSSPRADFRFVYRNSIEHFYPQHPDEQQSGSLVSGKWLHSFGNLALVSVGANSKFSNSIPASKALNYRSTIETQSPKLHAMAEITRRQQRWSNEQVMAHRTEMVTLLRQDLGLDLG